MASLEDRARKARNLATETFGSVSRSKTKKLVNQNAKSAGKKLTPAQEKRATDIMQTRRQNDRNRTATRAAFIAGPNSPRAKRADTEAMAAGVTGASKKMATKKAAAKKPAPKPKVEKRAPMETTRIGGIISVPKRPKKTVY